MSEFTAVTRKRRSKKTRPSCQIRKDRRPDEKRKGCSAILLDKTQEYVVIVKEREPPNKWGLPKGHFKVGEKGKDCVHREVCEEVGLEIDSHPHSFQRMRVKNAHKVIFDKSIDELPLIRGEDEILATRWVSLEWLQNDIRLNRPKYNRSVIALL